MTQLLAPIKVVTNLVGLAYTAVAFKIMRRNDKHSSYYLVSAFCRTGGLSNGTLNRIISWLHPPVALSSANGVLGDLTPVKLKSVCSELRIKGYYQPETSLSKDKVTGLVEMALNAPVVEAPSAEHPEGLPLAKYPRDNPKNVVYRLSEETLLDDALIQELISDPSILALAQAYLGCQPIVSHVQMWWSTSYVKTADKGAAQWWHFDMENPKWFKVFVYLTDVTEQCGPHEFIEGSHRPRAIPKPLLKPNYARISDEEVSSHFDSSKIKTFKGNAGTLLIEDTSGIHRGRRLIKGDRLLCVLQFSDSEFGCVTGLVKTPFKNFKNKRFQDFYSRYPRIYSKFVHQ